MDSENTNKEYKFDKKSIAQIVHGIMEYIDKNYVKKSEVEDLINTLNNKDNK